MSNGGHAAEEEGQEDEQEEEATHTMVTRRSQRWCTTCRRMTLHGRKQTSGWAVLAVMVMAPLALSLVQPVFAAVLFGLMLLALPVMGVVDLMRQHRCEVCGAYGGLTRAPATLDTAATVTPIERHPVAVDPALVRQVWQDVQAVDAARRLDHPPAVGTGGAECVSSSPPRPMPSPRRR